MKFFFDNNLSPSLAEGMKAFGEEVVHLQEEFAPDARDEDWLPIVGGRKWILVTRDERIRYNALERKLLLKHRVSAFFLGGKSRTRCQLIEQVVRNWSGMREVAAGARGHFLMKVAATGKKLDRLPS